MGSWKKILCKYFARYYWIRGIFVLVGGDAAAGGADSGTVGGAGCSAEGGLAVAEGEACLSHRSCHDSAAAVAVVASLLHPSRCYQASLLSSPPQRIQKRATLEGKKSYTRITCNAYILLL